MGRVTVRLPRSLADVTGAERETEVDGTTLREAIDDLVRLRPGLGRHLFDESGAMRRHILCFCNDVYTRGKDGLDAPISPGDEITLLNSVSGGSRQAPEVSPGGLRSESGSRSLAAGVLLTCMFSWRARS